MTKCKTEGCVNENSQKYHSDGNPRWEYCSKCIHECRYLPEDGRIKVMAARMAIDELWDAIMNLEDQYANGYFLELINDSCVDEKNHSDDHNIVWQ